MTFTATDPQNHKGNSQTWLTPLNLINELGCFDLDPCGYKGHKTANKIITLPDDGLAENWHGRVWLNPPYGKNAKLWLDKLYCHGNGIALVFARLETIWIQKFISNGFFQIEGRIKFLDENFLEQSNAGAPSILIPFGRKNIGSILASNIRGRWYQ